MYVGRWRPLFALMMSAWWAVPVMAHAQTSSRIALVSGMATDQRGVRSSAWTLAPSVTVSPDPRVAFSVFGSATQFAEQVRSFGGGGAMAVRVPLSSRVALTSALNGNAARTSFNATFASGDGNGGAELSLGPLALQGGVHGARGYTAFVTTSPSPAPPLVPVPRPSSSQTQRTSLTRRASGAYYGAAVRVLQRTNASFAITARVTPLTVSDVAVRDDVLGAVSRTGPLSLQLQVGRRVAADERVQYATASGSLAFNTRFALEASGGSYPSDRLSGAQGGRYVTAGLSVRLGGPSAPRKLKVPGRAAPTRGMTRLAIRVRDASRVELAGDWNNWQRVPAQRAGTEVWYVDIALSPGEYRYTFLVDGKDWRVPEEVVSADDGFGSKVAWVTVRALDTK